MDRKITVFALLLVCLAALPAAATVGWTVDVVGAQKVYNYTFTNVEETGSDPVVGFHVFAPLDAALIIGHNEPAGWTYGTTIDYSGALDIYWTADIEDAYLFAGDMLYVQIVTSAEVRTLYDYVLPDFLIGNWGYDTRDMGGTWTMYGSVPVPEGTSPVVPEPCSLLALGAGMMLLIRRIQR